MNIETMNLEELETRAAEIATETAEATEERLAELSEELEAIETRKTDIVRETEERKAKMEAVVEGAGDIVAKPMVEEVKHMENIRESRSYKEAWGEYIKAGYDLEKINEEARALLTVNAPNDGTIEVPVSVENFIHTAWERDEIMNRVRISNFKGNLKVGYEASAGPAVVHTEGGDPVAPEELVVGYTELIPQMVKKVVELSDEVIANNAAMVDYIYDEEQYQLVKLVANRVVAAIEASPLTTVSTMAGATPTTADIINAAALLSGEATDPVIITTRAVAAAIKVAALSAGYAYDPFDGMPVLYNDSLTAPFIIADLNGVQANFPDGREVKFKFDDTTKADSDIVRIIGKLYVGIGVVAPGKTVVATVESE